MIPASAVCISHIVCVVVCFQYIGTAMDKSEWVNQFQDELRQKGPNAPLKNYVHTREAPFSAQLSASVSPCVWLYDTPFQITVNLVGGGSTIVIDNELRIGRSTEADVGRLLDRVQIVKCRTRGCRNPAFDPSTTLKHRDGRCEQCAMELFNKEFEQAQLAERKKLAQMDRKHRARGFTHRVDAWVHADGGDQQLSIWMCDPTEAAIHDELTGSGVTDLQHYTVHQL